MAAPVDYIVIVSLIASFSCLSLVTGDSDSPPRKIHVSHNPGCNVPACQSPSNVSLYHVRAVGPNDSIHYLISNLGLPTILSAIFSSAEPVSVHVDWETFLSNNTDKVGESVRFDRKPDYTSSLVFLNVIEYNDRNDSTILPRNRSDDVILHPFTKFTWKADTNVTDGSDDVTDRSDDVNNGTDDVTYGEVVMTTQAGLAEFDDGGAISFKIRFHGEDGRQDQLPHLQYNSNLTQMEVSVAGFLTQFNRSRLGLTMMLVSEDFISQDMPIVTRESLDDEHSPGVFKVVDWQTRANCSNGNFVQWKPIAYTQPIPSIKYGVSVQYNDSKSSPYHPSRTLSWAYYGYNVSNIASQAAYVTFGMSRDGFYSATNFSVWSVNFGYGTPPLEQFSTMIIVVIAIGLGLPVLLIVTGSVTLCCIRRRRARNNVSYTAIST